jgi:hypothetical protein
MAEEAEELNRVLRCLNVEAQAPRPRAGEIGEVALARQADEAVSENLPSVAALA